MLHPLQTKSISISLLCLVLKMTFLMIIILLTGVQRLVLWTFNEPWKLDIRKSTGLTSCFVCIVLLPMNSFVPITHLLILCLRTSTVPAKWKCVHVILIPKTAVIQVNNIRPISLLPLVVKLLEKGVLNNCKKNIISNVDNYPFAYKPKGSTTCAIFLFHDICMSFGRY